MARRTKKVGRYGKFGARYGLSVKKRIRSIEIKKSSKYHCPRCSKENVRRVSTGIWQCRSCDLKFAGGAYSPKTPKHKMLESKLGGI
ncbi:MAG: 50S ribosomal protein L37ae [Candidatus Thermoplasmatota archaeon]|nr:50S ribosomal protein L37ae [Candidatus Thermoplasmatota archaeon]